MKKQLKFVLDDFAARQFDKAKAGLGFINCEKQAFADKIQDAYDKEEQVTLVDGYAPFCKHLFVKNFTDTLPTFIKITPENMPFLRSGYEARRENELAVLARWFDVNSMPEGTVKKAEYLDIILYSKDQIIIENKAQGSEDPNIDVEYDYGIISIKAQDQPHELPMQPITAMRNALGKAEGGSGVPIDIEKYKQSVAFWNEHATLK